MQGHSPDTGWRDLAEATVALRAGAVWVACNLDPTLPTERGPLPGNGSMVAALRIATGREPQVAGKPAPALMDASVQRVGARRPLMIGDRLDTDIEGGRAAGMATLLVLTGVSDAAELLAAPPERRPDYVAADLAGLTQDPADLAPGPRPGWTVDGQSGHWTLTRRRRPARRAARALRGALGGRRGTGRRRSGRAGARPKRWTAPRHCRPPRLPWQLDDRSRSGPPIPRRSSARRWRHRGLAERPARRARRGVRAVHAALGDALTAGRPE